MCGHDLHMSAWAGTAEIMAKNREHWHGTLMLVGQPAEEIVAGATAMLRDGLFTRFPKPDYALGMHDEPSLPAGVPGPGLHSSSWMPEREPTIKAAINGQAAILTDLLNGKSDR